MGGLLGSTFGSIAVGGRQISQTGWSREPDGNAGMMKTSADPARCPEDGRTSALSELVWAARPFYQCLGPASHCAQPASE